MFKYNCKKFVILVLTVYCIVSLLVSCTNSSEGLQSIQKKTQDKSPDTPETLENNGTLPTSRLSEVLDPNKYAEQFTIRAFNVKHEEKDGNIITGDCSLLIAPDGTTMLIDAGYKSDFPSIMEDIKKIGVTKLDYIVATHMHSDHVGGIPYALETMPVGKVMTTKYTDPRYGSSSSLLEALQKRNMQLHVLKEEDSFFLGEGVKVEVLNPENRDDVEFSDNDYLIQHLNNELSLVLKITYGDHIFLFTGDIQTMTEFRLAEKYGEQFEVDLLQVAHHGYHSSSSSVFLKAFSPKMAWIPQCSTPPFSVYSRIKKVCSNIYITGLDGILLFASNGKEITVITEKDRESEDLKLYN
ncbi:MAG TPA: MBL fold metallo-hydrolase [Clostridiales bacterium]|nr:MBL fold metallo-hydrolase [Clostridiales bacterium]